jgi:hypothetical protein
LFQQSRKTGFRLNVPLLLGDNLSRHFLQLLFTFVQFPWLLLGFLVFQGFAVVCIHKIQNFQFPRSFLVPGFGHFGDDCRFVREN